MEKQMEDIFFTLQGEAVEPVPGVENVFAPEMPCEGYYQEILEAYRRICLRLGAREEDPDVEAILSASMSITHILCQKMYEYGGKYGSVYCFCWGKR